MCIRDRGAVDMARLVVDTIENNPSGSLRYTYKEEDKMCIRDSPPAIGNAFHITTDKSMTWNQIYETMADAVGKPLNALHVASDFLAGHGETYDFRG